MFEAGEGWECWQIMREFPLRNWKKNTLNDFIRKLVEMEGLQPGSPEEVLTPALNSGWTEFHWSFVL